MNILKLLGFLAILINFWNTALATIEPIAKKPFRSRRNLFSQIQRGKKLANTVPLKEKEVKRELGCATLCEQTEACRSFNYCGNRVCTLNTADLHALGKVQTNIS